MAKFNLSSVYTKDNIYSVLKLLKALIDTLDNYEFEEPIKDKDGNEIPMEWFANLYNSIHGDANGNVEIGKDSHVDGSLNVDLAATIASTIKLAKNKIKFSYAQYEKMYFADVTLKYEGNRHVPGIIAITQSGYMAFLIDYNKHTLTIASSPVSSIAETDNGFDIADTPFEYNSIDFSKLETLPSRVNNMESQFSTIAQTAEHAKIASTQNASAIAALQSLINDLPVKIFDGTEDADTTETGANYVGDLSYDDNADCVVFGRVEQSRTDFTFDGLVVFSNGATYVAEKAFLDSTGDLHGGKMTPIADITKFSKPIRHDITVRSASYFAMFTFYNTYNEPIDSPQDLTTYLKPTTASRFPCTCFTNVETPAPAAMNAIKYASSVWKFCLVGGTAEKDGDSILSVSDIVTAVS